MILLNCIILDTWRKKGKKKDYSISKDYQIHLISVKDWSTHQQRHQKQQWRYKCKKMCVLNFHNICMIKPEKNLEYNIIIIISLYSYFHLLLIMLIILFSVQSHVINFHKCFASFVRWSRFHWELQMHWYYFLHLFLIAFNHCL